MMSRLRTHSTTAKTSVKVKQRKCAVCESWFDKRSMGHVACSMPCAAEVARLKREKAEAKAARVDRVETRAKLEAMKGIPKLKAEAEKACHAWIRYRDRLLPCICCGRWPLSSSLKGGDWDACHYRGRGAADHLRYHEDNIHRGLKSCNTYGHKDYRGGLIARIGIERVEALERNQAIVKWTPDLLRQIRDGFKAKLKAAMAANKN